MIIHFTIVSHNKNTNTVEFTSVVKFLYSSEDLFASASVKVAFVKQIVMAIFLTSVQTEPINTLMQY